MLLQCEAAPGETTADRQPVLFSSCGNDVSKAARDKSVMLESAWTTEHHMNIAGISLIFCSVQSVLEMK